MSDRINVAFRYKRKSRNEGGKTHIYRKMRILPDDIVFFPASVAPATAPQNDYIIILSIPTTNMNDIVQAYVFRTVSAVKAIENGEKKLVGYRVLSVVPDSSIEDDLASLAGVLAKKIPSLGKYIRSESFSELVKARIEVGQRSAEETHTMRSSGGLSSIIMKILGKKQEEKIYVALVGFSSRDSIYRRILHLATMGEKTKMVDIVFGGIPNWESVLYLTNKVQMPVILLINKHVPAEMRQSTRRILAAADNQGVPKLVVDDENSVTEDVLAKLIVRAMPDKVSKMLSARTKRVLIAQNASAVGKTFLSIGTAMYISRQGVSSAVLDVGQGGLQSLERFFSGKIHTLRSLQENPQSISELPRYKAKSTDGGTLFVSCNDTSRLQEQTAIQSSLNLFSSYGMPYLAIDIPASSPVFNMAIPIVTEIVMPISHRETTAQETEDAIRKVADVMASLATQNERIPRLILVYNCTDSKTNFNRETATTKFLMSHFPIFSRVFKNRVKEILTARHSSNQSEFSMRYNEIMKRTKEGKNLVTWTIVPHAEKTIAPGVPVPSPEDLEKIAKPVIDILYLS